VEVLVVTMLGCVLTAVYLWPITRLWRDHLAPGLGDTVFVMYLLRWVHSQLGEGLGKVFSPEFWSPPFFFPTKGVLAFSEHMIGPGLLTLPAASAVDSPAAPYNLLLASSFILTLAISYLVLRLSCLAILPALFASLAFAFSPYRFGQLAHVQLLFVAFAPLTLWAFDRLLRRPTAVSATLFFSSYAFHILGGTYLAFMIHVPLLVVALNRLTATTEGGIRHWRRIASPKTLGVLMVVVIACGVLAASIFAPYIALSGEHEMTRSEIDLKNYGATTLAFLTPSKASRYSELADPLKSLARGYGQVPWKAEKSLFAGFLPTILAFIGLGALMIRRPAKGLKRWQKSLLAMTGVAAIAGFVVADVITFAVLSPPIRIGRLYDIALAVILLSVLAWLILGWRWGRGLPFGTTGLSVWARGLLWAGVACVLLAFPVFFEPISDRVPGFAKMRVPARFWALGLFPFAFLAGTGLAALLRRVRRPRVWGCILIVLLLLEIAPRPFRWQRVDTFASLPGVNHWLIGRDDVSAVLELPTYSIFDEVRFMHRSSFGWIPLANGFSGHFPDSYRRMRHYCCNPIPDDEGIIELRRMGITHLVVHSYGWKRGDRRRVENWLRKVRKGRKKTLREVYDDDWGNRVIQLVEPRN